MNNFNFLITAHSDNPTRLSLLLECIKSIKRFGYKAIVVDHYFNHEAFDLADGFVWIEDNDIVTPEHWHKYNLHHASQTIYPNYDTYTPYGSFAPYAIINQFNKGHRLVEGEGVFSIHYDFQLNKDVAELIGKYKHRDGIFFKYPPDNASLFSSCFYLKKPLWQKFERIKSLDHYMLEINKYMEWYFYQEFKDENIEILNTHPRDYFVNDLYYRSSYLNLNCNLYACGEEVLFNFKDSFEILEKKKDYYFEKENKKLNIHLNKDHFKYHTFRKK
tara:strand:+ start:1465 stop:2286 length:822 start_codon:yes stop_codon:yes gene_type:complete